MRKLLKIIFISMLLLMEFNCDNNPVTQTEDKPGRRDYTWTVDTVVSPKYYDFKTLYRLWASSPTDVWASANGGDATKDIFHFDGYNWTAGGKYNIPYQPNSIYGFSASDVYIGCAAGRIYHYNGSSIKEAAALTKDGHGDIVFDRMWGDNPNDIYATGAYPDALGLYNGSVIAHYTNNKWEMLNTDGLDGIVGRPYKNIEGQSLYMQVVKYSNTFDTSFIYEYSGGKYTQLYKTVLGSNWANISFINGDVYFILNKKIATRVDGEFQTVLDLGNTNFYYNIWGRNSEDIFLEMKDGLAHYNGTDIKYLFHYNQSNVEIFDAALFPNDVFFLVYEYTTGHSLVYHGRLKQ